MVVQIGNCQHIPPQQRGKFIAKTKGRVVSAQVATLALRCSVSRNIIGNRGRPFPVIELLHPYLQTVIPTVFKANR